MNKVELTLEVVEQINKKIYEMMMVGVVQEKEETRI